MELPEEYRKLSPDDRVEIINYVRERLASLDEQSYSGIAKFIKDVDNRVKTIDMLIAEMYSQVGAINYDDALAVVESKLN